MPPNQDKTSNGKHIEQYRRPQLLCVLLVQRIYAIDLAHDATVGERSRNSKFSYVSPRSIYGETSNEGKESASTYPCRSLSGSVQANGVEGVVLVVIQITGDPSAERTAPPRSTHVQPDDVSQALIQQGERERLGKTPSSSSTMAWWWWRSMALQQGFAKHCERRGGRGVGLRQQGKDFMCWAAPLPPLYIGGRGGMRPHLGFHPRGGG